MLNNKDITLNKTKDITLSIQFSLDGFSFCTSNSEKKSLFRHYNFDNTLNSAEELLTEIKSIFNNDSDLQAEFSKIEVVHQNNLSTLVPNVYFDENSISEYLKYNIKTLNTDFITFDEIATIDAKNVYIPYVNINNYLFQNFGEFEYQHHITVLLEKLLTANTAKEKIMYLNVNKNTFDIVILEENKLIFANSFHYTSKEDFIYYVLFAAEQNQLDTEQFKLYLLGDITNESELYQIAFTYIRHIDFLESEDSIYTELNIPKHTNYLLLG